MSIPLASPGKTLEAIRLTARRRLSLAAAFLAAGALLLSVARPLLIFQPVGFVTGLILAALLLVIGLSQGLYGATAFSRAFPLSELAEGSRQALVLTLFAVVPLSLVAAAAWILLVLPETPYQLIPSLPLFWGPLAAFAAIGLLTAARELTSERMAVLAAVGGGFVACAALFSATWSVVDSVGALEDPLFSEQLLLVGIGFILLALAFRQDAWIARAGRRA